MWAFDIPSVFWFRWWYISAFYTFAVGPVIDRANKVNAMRLTTLIEFIAIGLLVFMSFLDALSTWVLFVTILCYTVAQVFEAPSARLSFAKL